MRTAHHWQVLLRAEAEWRLPLYDVSQMHLSLTSVSIISLYRLFIISLYHLSTRPVKMPARERTRKVESKSEGNRGDTQVVAASEVIRK